MKIKVSKSTHAKSNIMHLTTEAANALKEYPRREALFAMIDDEDGEEKPAIGIVPETSINSGAKLTQRKGTNFLTGHCPKDILPVGEYTMSEIPIYENQIDWFLLSTVK